MFGSGLVFRCARNELPLWWHIKIFQHENREINLPTECCHSQKGRCIVEGDCGGMLMRDGLVRFFFFFFHYASRGLSFEGCVKLCLFCSLSDKNLKRYWSDHRSGFLDGRKNQMKVARMEVFNTMDAGFISCLKFIYNRMFSLWNSTLLCGVWVLNQGHGLLIIFS